MIVPHVESVLTSGLEMTMAEGSIDVSDRPRRVETRQARMSSQPPTHDDHDGGASDENADGRLDQADRAQYARETLDSPNPIARFAHRRRHATGAALCAEYLSAGAVGSIGSHTGSTPADPARSSVGSVDIALLSSGIML